MVNTSKNIVITYWQHNRLYAEQVIVVRFTGKCAVRVFLLTFKSSSEMELARAVEAVVTIAPATDIGLLFADGRLDGTGWVEASNFFEVLLAAFVVAGT
jgi:hypothetical protein